MPDICAKCNGVIEGTVTTALDKKWHPEHFTCFICSKPIEGHKFFSHNDQPICEKDYLDKMASKCAKCNKSIVGEVISALDKKWHPEHFCCAHCKKPIEEVAFKTHEGKPYCSKDYTKLYAPKCKECKQHIEGSVIKALDAEWHPQCFKCSKCQKPIEGSSFKNLNGKPCCSSC